MKKIIYIYGPQQSGKTLFLRNIIQALGGKVDNFIYDNKPGEIWARCKRRPYHMCIPVLVVEEFKFYKSEKQALIDIVNQDTQLILTSHNHPPIELRSEIIIMQMHNPEFFEFEVVGSADGER